MLRQTATTLFALSLKVAAYSF